MKYSGVAWIGEIPDHWHLIRLKDKWRSVKEIAGEDSAEYDRLALTMNGVIQRPKDDSDGLQPKEFDGYQILRENDFVFKMIDLQNVSTSRVGLSTYTGLVSPAYIRFAPKRKEQYCKYTYYYLMSMYYNCVFNSLGGDGVRSALNAADMGTLLIPYPDEETQKRIVARIEKRVAAIDALIANQEKQVEKLKQYKQALITETVTKGLDPTVPMKDSGVEWIGMIPASWEVSRFKNIMRREKRICEKRDNESILSLTMNGVIIRDLDNPVGKMPSSFDGYQFVEPGDLLLCLFDIDVTPRCTGLVTQYGITSPAYSRYKMRQGFFNAFYNYFLTSIDDRKIFVHLSKNLRSSLSDEHFGAIAALVPSYQEQKAIVGFLDRKCEQIDQLIETKTQKIEKLNQYKKSLIYEYVTGKKEVV